MMKYVFVLILLLVGGAASVQGILLVYRWNHNMTVTQRIMPGEMSFAMAPGSLPREGGQLYYSKEQREAASARKNPCRQPRSRSRRARGSTWCTARPATALPARVTGSWRRSSCPRPT